MTLEEHIDGVREAIRGGRFVNEAAISQGVVLRLLNALDWPTYDTDIICPEFSLQGRRVDYALCHPPKKPVAFVEVKQPGHSDSAERQLFEYAFHEGIPLAILTNGQEWSFFLPAGQGTYGDRRVYKLDLLERSTEESAYRLKRYLLHNAVVNGIALSNARDDYQSIARDRQIEASLPDAWARVVAEEDETLVQLLIDRVEVICGYKPEPDAISRFLKRLPTATQGGIASLPLGSSARIIEPQNSGRLPTPSRPTVPTQPISFSPPAPTRSELGFTLDGAFFHCRNAIGLLRKTLEEFHRLDPSFYERFAARPKHGRSRRYLARRREELYPGRNDLSSEYCEELPGGWFMSTNHSKATIRSIVVMACEVAGIPEGRRYLLSLPD